jgi:hypothetical protein
MANGWTPERRLRQAMLIQSWRPWERSSGPQTATGKAVVSRNAFKGGTRPEMRRLLAKANQLLRNQLGILKKLEVETRETD